MACRWLVHREHYKTVSILNKIAMIIMCDSCVPNGPDIRPVRRADGPAKKRVGHRSCTYTRTCTYEVCAARLIEGVP